MDVHESVEVEFLKYEAHLPVEVCDRGRAQFKGAIDERLQTLRTKYMYPLQVL